MRRKAFQLVILTIVFTIAFVAKKAVAEFDFWDDWENLDFEQQSGLVWYYDNGDGTATICGYDWEYETNDIVEIPSVVDGLTVTTIESLYNDSSMDISCQLLRIPDTVVELSSHLFSTGTIDVIVIPNSVQIIHEGAFSGIVVSMFSVDPHHPVYASMNGSLYEKATKTLLAFAKSDSVGVPEGILRIGDYAFADADLKIEKKDLSFLIPSSIMEIGECAFRNCFIKSKSSHYKLNTQVIEDSAFANATIWNPYNNGIELEISATSIGAYAFFDMDVSIISLLRASEIGPGAFGNTEALRATPLYIHPALTAIEDGAFRNSIISAKSMNDWESYMANEHVIIIPEGIETIGDFAFAENESIDRIELPQTLREIGAGAFSGCSELRSVVLPEGITVIAVDAFDRDTTIIYAVNGSYAAQWALKNGYVVQYIGESSNDWLN